MQAQQTTSHNDGPPWNIITNGGPVVATAIHAGHVVRDELAPYLAIDPEDRRREEDPLTDYFLSLSDNLVRRLSDVVASYVGESDTRPIGCKHRGVCPQHRRLVAAACTWRCH